MKLEDPRGGKMKFQARTGFEPMTSAIPVSQRSWVQIPYGPENFFRSYLQLLVSVVFLAARIF